MEKEINRERVEYVKNIVAQEIEKELEKGVVKELLLQAISDASEEGKSEDPLAYLGIQEAIYESRHSEHYKKYHEFDKPFSELMDMPKIQGSLGRLEEAGISVASFFENKIKAGVQKEKQDESGEKKPVPPMRHNKGNNENNSSSSSDSYISTLDRDQNDDRVPGKLVASPITAAKALVRIPFLLPAYVIGRTFLRGTLATASAVENLSHDNQVIQNAMRPENKPTTSAQPILSDEGIGNAANSDALLSQRKSNLSDSAIKSVQFTDSQKLAPTIIKSRSNGANSSSRSGIVAFKDEVIDPTWMEESIYPTPRTIPGYDIAFASDIAKALCDRNDVYDHTSYIPAPKGFHKDEEELRLSISEGCNDADSSSEESSLPATRTYHHNELNLTL